MLKLFAALCLASVVAGEQILDVHDASKCNYDDKSETDGCCASLFDAWCDDLYYNEFTGTCSNGKEKFTCICKSGDFFCDENDWSSSSDWDSTEWDAEWEEACNAVARAFWTTLILAVFLPVIVCIIICVCCCYCNKTCCFEKKMEPIMIYAEQQQAPQQTPQMMAQPMGGMPMGAHHSSTTSTTTTTNVQGGGGMMMQPG